MLRVPTIAGASLIAVLGSLSGAEAKKVTYEVNGQRYSYSTNNREQTAAARRHMEAARAAAAAKAKAEAERAANPLAAVFGSPAQREAALAAAQLEQARPQLPTASSSASAEPPRRLRLETRREAKPTVAAQPDEKGLATASPAIAAKGVAAAAAPVVAEPPLASPPRIRSVSFDASTGIKTVFMSDGTIREEPFDSSAPPIAGSQSPEAQSLNAFVEQLRPAPEDMTGSTWASAGSEPSLRPGQPRQ